MKSTNDTAVPVLLVDDDHRITSLLVRYLQDYGFTVDVASTARRMWDKLACNEYGAMVLDIMLPDGDGQRLCQELRAKSFDLPIIMLTAKGDEADRIVSLETGATDYLSKPFSPRELVARLRAALRSQRFVHGAPDASVGVLRVGPLTIDPVRRSVEIRETVHELSTVEFAVLFAFANNPNQTLSRSDLLRLARGKTAAADDRSIDVQVSRLRRLIEEKPNQPSLLQTVWGKGYVLVVGSDVVS